jgi:hypothetical protein
MVLSAQCRLGWRKLGLWADARPVAPWEWRAAKKRYI